jgi:translation initiation factor 3 subunit B
MNSDDEDVNVEEVKSESGFGNVVVVDNLPKVPSAKVEKLTTVLKKIFGQIGLIHENGLVMPVDDTGSTKGFAFVEFHGAAEAAAAREQTDGYKLDKAHVFKTSSFDDFAKFERVPDSYEQPKPKPWTPKENTQSYMLDERGRDQYAIRFGDATEIHWNDAQKSAPVEVYKRDFWTESYVQWSPRGNFLATVHRQGVALWGGPGFTRFQKFSHNGVQFIEFSPCERFLASGSTHDEGREATVLVSFFDTRSGAKLRSFQGPISDFAVGSGARGGLTWPVFKWGGPSPDGAFFARMKMDQISVYEAPTMTLVDKKSISLEGVVDFCWSPADPILSVFQPEQGGGNQPARVSLISLPSKKEIRSKNLFSVSDVKMYWQQSGDYFACKVDHHTKSKKSIYSGFELFRVKEPNCPMEVLELPDKNQKIVAFAWEPKGHRFAVIHGDGARPDVSFYAMMDKDSAVNKVKRIGTLQNKTANHLFWSPQGGTIVLAGLKTMNGQFEFFNVDEMETMASAEHFMATDVEWDPTGRYVTTAVTSVHQMENGFHVWTFNGRLLYKHGRERFYQFLWRPRAPSLLGAEKEREIAKNLKKYSKRFEELDDAIRNAQDSHLAAEKKGVLDEWNKWVAAKKAEMEAPAYAAKVEALMRARYPGWKPGGDEDVVEEQVEVEDIISVEEEPYVGGMMM